MRKLAVTVLCLLTLVGCASGRPRAERVREVKVGMSAERVEAMLGEPDLVRQERKGHELWCYYGTGGNVGYVMVKDDKVVLTHP